MVAVVADEVVGAVSLAVRVDEAARHVRRTVAVPGRGRLPRDGTVTCHRLPTHVITVVPGENNGQNDKQRLRQ